MTILCTHPGRHGDLLWALPTVRAIAEATGEPVDLALNTTYGSLAPLLERQSYLRNVLTVTDWAIEESAPIRPRAPSHLTALVNGELADLTDPGVGAYDRIVHLGYTGWPIQPLPDETFRTVREEHPDLPLQQITLRRPWITPPYDLPAHRLSVGFTDEHFELKYGLYWLLRNHFGTEVGAMVNLCTSPRWRTEAGHEGFGWEAAAAWLAVSQVFVGCCSALHVLAVAVGTPVVVMEPNEMRLHPVFWPCGQDGPQVTLVRGDDQRQTFDARQTILTIEQVLAGAEVRA